LILACIADADGIRRFAGHARDSGCVRTKKIFTKESKMNNENLTRTYLKIV